MIGEIGAQLRKTAEFLKKSKIKKPTVGFVAGLTPSGEEWTQER